MTRRSRRPYAHTVAKMAFEGMTDMKIAEAVDASPETVRSMVRRVAKLYSGDHRKDITRYGFLVKLPEHSLTTLMACAKALDCGPTELAERILDSVLMGGAVMDA